MSNDASEDAHQRADTLAFADTAALEQALVEHDIPLDNLPRETVGRRAPASVSHAGASLERLPPVTIAPPGPAANNEFDYVVAEELGGGGMGVVELAEQVVLDRQVAMKRARSPDAEAEVLSLLHEARITGCLEHPNVVPVHAVGVDAMRGPVVVMKCVHGTAWETLIAAGETPLERQLEILMQVSNAVAFAHSKGIVHCDIKPANVMVGEFGAVYLVDWGIAIKLGAPGGDRPRGSPAYMAPELVAGLRAHIDERTDVYLLGACLHEILTGQPRHDGDDLMVVLRNAMQSAAARFDPGVPEELAAICNRACHPEPGERHASAAAFREAVQSFLDDRSARALIGAASARVEALTAAIARTLDRSDDGKVDDDDQTVRALFRESQFAFEHVRKTRPGLSDAEAGLERCLTVMFGYEVALGNLPGARALLQAMAKPTKQARAELAQLHERHEHEQRRMAELEHAADSSVAAAERSRLGKVFMILAVLVVVGLFFVNRNFGAAFTPLGLFLIAVAMWAIVVACSIAFRGQLFANDYNRRRIHVPLGWLTAVAAHRGLAWLMDAPIAITLTMDLVLLAAVTFMAGTISKIYYPAAAGLVAAAMVTAWQPVTAKPLLNLTILSLALLTWWQWTRPPKPSADASKRGAHGANPSGR
jgi:serine/threonine-protein kinase